MIGVTARAGLTRTRETVKGGARDWLVPVAIALLAVGLRLAVGAQPIDDAYITMRYARNIAEGLGFVYNPGQHVLGTTTPLWTLILAAFYWLGFHDLPSVALVIGSIADAFTCTLLVILARRFGLPRSAGLVVGLLYAVLPVCFWFTVGGMETSLFVLLIVASVTADASDRRSLAAGLAALAVLTRPDGLILVAALGLRLLRERRLPTVRSFGAFGLILVPWLTFATLYFGNPLPQSMRAKEVVYSTIPVGNMLAVVGNLGNLGFFAVLCLLPFAPTFGRFIWHRANLTVAAAFAPAFALAYEVAGARGIMIFPWYSAALVPFALLGLVGLVAVVSRHRPFFGLVAALLLLAVVLPIQSLIQGNPWDGMDASANARQMAYEQAAAFLRPRVTAESVVAAPEIGTLGYFSEAPILDTVGLASPDVMQFYPYHPTPDDEGDYWVPPSLIRTAQPDYIVTMPLFLSSGTLSDPWFRQTYAPIATFPIQGFVIGSSHRVVTVYERR